MHIALAQAENLRLYRQFVLRPHPRLNLIVGPNASGKTTLLEALYYLSRARSFRAGAASELTGDSGQSWTVFAELSTASSPVRLGVGWNGVSQEQKLDSERVRLSALPRVLPLQLIDPLGHRLVEDGPGYRRSYLDWGVFHVEPSFYPAWLRYQRSLKQRNQALKQGLSVHAVAAWDGELVKSAEEVTRHRAAHAKVLADQLPRWVGALLDVADASLEFNQGWSGQHSYAEVLDQQSEQHRRLGTTVQGPHRAELKLVLGGGRAKGRLSRGQQKLLVAALVLAQCSLVMDSGRPAPVILVDDFSAELSTLYQQRFADALTRYPGQTFITAFESPPAFALAEKKLFHVEQGRLLSALEE